MSLQKDVFKFGLESQVEYRFSRIRESCPSRKNSISRSRKVGQQHNYLDYLRTKLTIQEEFLGVKQESLDKYGKYFFIKALEYQVEILGCMRFKKVKSMTKEIKR